MRKNSTDKEFLGGDFSVKKTIIIDLNKICTTNVMNDEQHGTLCNRDSSCICKCWVLLYLYISPIPVYLIPFFAPSRSLFIYLSYFFSLPKRLIYCRTDNYNWTQFFKIISIMIVKIKNTTYILWIMYI